MTTSPHQSPTTRTDHRTRGSRPSAEVLRGHEIRQSVGRTGICYDNAMAEFFAALKNERVNRTQYPTRETVRLPKTSSALVVRVCRVRLELLPMAVAELVIATA